MNLFQRMHSHGQSHPHDNAASGSHSPPFWIRHYDLVVNLITLGRTREVHEGTLSLAKLQPGESVLDVGCGTGALLMAAESIVGKTGALVGLDVEPAMVEQAERRAVESRSKATFQVASMASIPFPEAHFDVVFSTLMYHHLNEEERIAMFAEVSRVLKAGGRFALVDINPARRSILTSLPGHHRAKEDFVRGEVLDQMRTAGFTVIDDGPHSSKQMSYAIGTSQSRVYVEDATRL